jgi:hypothetical protein
MWEREKVASHSHQKEEKKKKKNESTSVMKTNQLCLAVGSTDYTAYYSSLHLMMPVEIIC